MSPIRSLLIGLIVSPFMTTAPGNAAGVLEIVPRDALGVVVVRDLSQVDAQTAKFFETLGVPLPGPLNLLETFAGVGAGLDTRRDLVVVLLPSENAGQPFHLALWLPVADYDALVRSLEGDPQRSIAAVTVAGEDLLVAHHGDWAIVMDPDQRGRLELLRAAAARPQRGLSSWETWVAENDVAVIALPAGIRAAWAWFAKQPRAKVESSAPSVPADDDLFGPPPDPASRDGIWTALLASCRSLAAEAPQLERWIIEAGGAGCALRLDESGNAVVSLRTILPDEALQRQETPTSAQRVASPLWLFDDGEFVVVGSGRVATRWSVLAVAPYVQNLSDDLATSWGVALDDDHVSQFRRAVEQAVADVHGFAALTRPGRGQEGVFTNSFLAVRVESADAFFEHFAEAMRCWNEMFDQASAPLRLEFESQAVQVAGRPGTEYAVDMASAEMAAALGAPATPEFRQSLEKLFGPGGKFRIQVISVDDETVLLALATEDQAAQAVKLLGEARPGADVAVATGGPLHAVNELLAEDADWRLYFSPPGYVHWLQRQLDAVLGPVIGGPIVRDVPASPPVGAAGGLVERTAWLELAVPFETLKVLGGYVRQ